MQVNQKPKITIDEDYLDLRDQSETLDDNKKSSKGKKSISKKRKSPVRTLNLQNEGLRYEKELINCGLKKLVTSYNTTANQHQRSYGAKRKNCNRENTVCDPRFRRYVETEDKCLKSQSELSVSGKKLDIEPVSSSTPLFYRKKKPNMYSKETESVKNSAALNKDSKDLNVSKENTLKHSHSRQTDFDNIETEIGTIDGVNGYKNVERSQNDPLNRDVDPRLVNKYSILKGPWKRSWTIPVFASRYKLTNKNQCDNSDRQTYLYDEGSDLDSSYVQIKHHQCLLKTGVPSQLMAILFVLGAACGIFLASILIYLIFGNNLIQYFFKPREVPEANLKTYFKFVGGGIIYVITSIVSTVGRVLSIPTQNVYEPGIHYK